MPIVECPPGSPFPGRIGRTADESTPAWPVAARAAPGTPNVVFVVPDDTRFNGTIHTVTIDVSGELINEPEAELRAHMARR